MQPYRTSLKKQTVKMFRNAAIQDKSLEEYTSLVTPYVNKCIGDVVIIKLTRSIPQFFSKPKKLPLSQGTRTHTTLPEQK